MALDVLKSGRAEYFSAAALLVPALQVSRGCSRLPVPRGNSIECHVADNLISQRRVPASESYTLHMTSGAFTERRAREEALCNQDSRKSGEMMFVA